MAAPLRHPDLPTRIARASGPLAKTIQRQADRMAKRRARLRHAPPPHEIPPGIVLPPDVAASLDAYRHSTDPAAPRYLYVVRPAPYSPGASILVSLANPESLRSRGWQTPQSHARHMGRAIYRAARAIAGLPPSAPNRGRESLVTLPPGHPLYASPLATPLDISYTLRTTKGIPPLPPAATTPLPDPPDPSPARARTRRRRLHRIPAAPPDIPPVIVATPASFAAPSLRSQWRRALALVVVAGGGTPQTLAAARRRARLPRGVESWTVGGADGDGGDLAGGPDGYSGYWYVDLVAADPAAIWIGAPSGAPGSPGSHGSHGSHGSGRKKRRKRNRPQYSIPVVKLDVVE